ncbi:FxDxF family PEP-CTERM protein [Ferribacterium limneticum]|uniref:FxDxF family PEP-CTERM protein n=1 Tax=Ferribacterium limneticum TaxID=76259 RepID=UPI001CFBC3C6|nr:FxDxF family PEP-CTERM protein [Ferribacterium limneticum]UCV19630.1 PEP-CTERM sorting domain-containing protein [Ferribacterium limneticum]
MNSIKKAICIAAIAASAGAQANAPIVISEVESNDTIATAQDLGSLVSGSEVNVVGLRFDFPPFLNSSVDYYKFSTASTLNFTFSVATLTGPAGENDPMVGLFSSTGNLIDMNDDISDDNYDSHLTRSVSAGTYYVAVTGYNLAQDFSGTGDKNWPYTLTISAAPVPEPESYAMFLAGLGIIGAVARRKAA